MIIRFFKDTKPVTSIAIPLLSAFCCLSVFWIPIQIIHYQNSIFNLIFQNILSDKLLIYLSVTIFLSIEALLLNKMANAQRIYKEMNSLPGFIYILLMTFFSIFWGIHPILLANLFFIPALSRLIQLKEGAASQRLIFDASFLIALAALIYLPFIFMLLLIPIYLIIQGETGWRVYATGLLGMTLPFLFFLVFSFLLNKTAFFYNYFYSVGIYTFPYTKLYYWISVAAVALIFIAAYLNYIFNLNQKALQVRNMYDAFIWIIVLQLLSLSLTTLNFKQQPVLFVLPAALIISNLIMSQRKRYKLTEWVFILFVLYAAGTVFNVFDFLN